MFCKKCGTKLDDDAVFCVKCGEKTGIAAQADDSKQNFETAANAAVTAAPAGGESQSSAPKKSGRKALIIGLVLGGLLLFLIVAGVLAAIFVPNIMRARAQGQLTACKSNLKNIATALEIYATDNADLYPPSLDYLTHPAGTEGGYMKSIPECYSAGKDTYSESYLHSENAYLLYCSGHNHKAVGLEANAPAMDSATGLQEAGIDGLIQNFRSSASIAPGQPDSVSPATAQELTTADSDEYITFGTYRYMKVEDESDPDYADPEPLEWIVLERDDNSALLITKYAIRPIRFNTGEFDKAIWKDCGLRKYLNDVFLRENFTSDELSRIQESVIKTRGSGETKDKVFLLSKKEAQTYFLENDKRKHEECLAKAYIDNEARFAPCGKTGWWLRTLADEYCVDFVVKNPLQTDGGSAEYIYEGGTIGIGNEPRWLRPVMRVSL